MVRPKTEIIDEFYINKEEALSNFINLLINKYEYNFNYDEFDIFYFSFFIYPIIKLTKDIYSEFFDNLYIKNEYKQYVYEVRFELKDKKLIYKIVGKTFINGGDLN